MLVENTGREGRVDRSTVGTIFENVLEVCDMDRCMIDCLFALLYVLFL